MNSPNCWLSSNAFELSSSSFDVWGIVVYTLHDLVLSSITLRLNGQIHVALNMFSMLCLDNDLSRITKPTSFILFTTSFY
jgi:hypothetical protein